MSETAITTAQQARAEMLAWANGEKSTWNQICGPGGVAQEEYAQLRAACCQADAAECQKWASVFQALFLEEKSHAR